MTTTTLTKTAAPAVIYAEALAAADAAFDAAVTTPIVVGEAKAVFGPGSDQIDYTKPTYYVTDGVCGFAWVNIKPARGKFVTYLKQQGIGRTDSYYGGYTLWKPTTRRSQSLARNEAAARAFADVLRSYGITAYAQSRLD